MMKKTSKITIIASLLLAGIVNAQEFYTCVPKKNTIMNININNVDELAKAITKIGGIGGSGAGGTNANQKKWQLITTINLDTKKEKENTIQDVRISNSFFTPGKYKFKLLLKDYNKDILNIFENIINLNEDAILFKTSLFGTYYPFNFDKILEFIKLYNYDKVIFIQDRNLRNSDTYYYNLKIENIRLNDVVLFSYETKHENNNDKQDYIIHNKDIYNNQYYKNVFFRYSTLEIYKQMDN